MKHSPSAIVNLAQIKNRFGIINRRHYLAALFKQAKVFVAGNSRCLEIVADDENGNFAVSWNHHRTRHAWFQIGTMTAFLPRELKTSRNNDALQSFPVNWREFGHGRSSRHRRGMFLN